MSVHDPAAPARGGRDDNVDVTGVNDVIEGQVHGGLFLLFAHGGVSRVLLVVVLHPEAPATVETGKIKKQGNYIQG